VQKVVDVEDEKVPVGKESLLIVVQGRVIAGMDLSSFSERNISVQPGGTVIVALPEPKILHLYLDEKNTKIWDRKVTWWTPWVPFNPALETRARQEALKQIEATALEMGILEDARRSAQDTASRLVRAAGAREVVFKPQS
jgi:hypothetical protein